jgi:DNA polymerase III delta prime subunit
MEERKNSSMNNYAPKSFAKEEFILPEEYRKIFQEYFSGKRSEHLLLSGTEGTGKTTAAKLLLAKAHSFFEIDCHQHSTAKNWKEGGNGWKALLVSSDLTSHSLSVEERENRTIKRCVLLEEFDAISSQGVFKTLLDKSSDHGVTCILTTNYLGDIEKAIQNRCLSLEFGFPSSVWMNYEGEKFSGARNQIEEDLQDLMINILKKEAPKSEKLINTLEIAHFFQSIIKDNYPSIRGITMEMRKWIIEERIDVPSQYLESNSRF